MKTNEHPSAALIARTALQLWVSCYGETHKLKVAGKIVERRPYLLRQGDGESKRWSIATRQVRAVASDLLISGVIPDPADDVRGSTEGAVDACEPIVAALMRCDTTGPTRLSATVDKILMERQNRDERLSKRESEERYALRPTESGTARITTW